MEEGTVVDAATVAPTYNKISENFRRFAPSNFQCSLFCGGKKCKYETANVADNNPIIGLNSAWISDDVLAMSRPNTAAIDQHDILTQFETVGIKSVINLEIPGEHEACSPIPLDTSGFTYDPVTLMDRGIYFYNYGWRDYGDASLAHLLDMVKVLCFAVSVGKVAVHCHAGLGRTGVLIASYLVYAKRLRANEAVRVVRLKRPGSIQSRLHILCVQQFEQFILPNCIIFSNRDITKDKKMTDFSLSQYLKRQRIILHGRESKTLRLIPKIVWAICERILSLFGPHRILDIEDELVWNEEESSIVSTPLSLQSPISFSDQLTVEDGGKFAYKKEDVIRAFLYDHVHMVEGLMRCVRSYRVDLNTKGPGAWGRLRKEKNLYVLSALLLLWLEHLRTPLLGSEELTMVVVYGNNPQDTFRKIGEETGRTVEYLMHFFALLDPEPDQEDALWRRIATALTQRIVPNSQPGFHTVLFEQAEKAKPRKLNDGTLSKLLLVIGGVSKWYKDGKTSAQFFDIPTDNENIS